MRATAAAHGFCWILAIFWCICLTERKESFTGLTMYGETAKALMIPCNKYHLYENRILNSLIFTEKSLRLGAFLVKTAVFAEADVSKIFLRKAFR